MGWLVNYVLASIAASFVALKLFDYIAAEAHGGLVSIARFGLFVATWTAVTARAGMNGFSSRIRNLRKGIFARYKP